MSCFCGRTKRPLEEVPLTCHVFEQTDDQKTLKNQIYFSIALLVLLQVENVTIAAHGASEVHVVQK